MNRRRIADALLIVSAILGTVAIVLAAYGEIDKATFLMTVAIYDILIGLGFSK